MAGKALRCAAIGVLLMAPLRRSAPPCAAQESRSAALEQLRELAPGGESPVLAVSQARPVAVSYGGPAAGQQGETRLSVYGRLVSFRDIVDVYEGGNHFGTVTRHYSDSNQFTYADAKGNELGRARVSFTGRYSMRVEILDASGRRLGTILEDNVGARSIVRIQYRVLDASGNLIAASEPRNWYPREIVLRDISGRAVGQFQLDLAASLRRLADKWDIAVSDAPPMNQRFLVFIAAIRISFDKERRSGPGG